MSDASYDLSKTQELTFFQKRDALIDYKDVFFLNHCIPDKELDIATKMYDTAGNMGNTYIMQCISKILFGKYIDPSQINGISNLFHCTNLDHIDTAYINNNYKYVLLNMQDQLRRDISYYSHKTNRSFRHINSLLQKIKIPLLCYGLGSNRLSEGRIWNQVPTQHFNDKKYEGQMRKYNTIVDGLYDSQKDFVKLVSEKSSVFSIRGQFTKRIMDSLNIKNYSMVGCPSFYAYPKPTHVNNQHIKKIVLTGGMSLFLEGNFREGAKDIGIELFYLCQDITEMDLIMRSRSLKDRMLNGIKIVYLTDTEDINAFFQDKDLAMGVRMHGNIMALNNNVPAVVIIDDARSTEMCSLFNIPHLSAFEFQHHSLSSIIDYTHIHLRNNNYTKFKKDHDQFIKDSLGV